MGHGFGARCSGAGGWYDLPLRYRTGRLVRHRQNDLRDLVRLYLHGHLCGPRPLPPGGEVDGSNDGGFSDCLRHHGLPGPGRHLQLRVLHLLHRRRTGLFGPAVQRLDE